MPGLSAEVTENYLKHIYRLSLDHSPVKTSHLAQALELSPAAVTEMLKRLDQHGLVDYTRYQGVALSASGRKRALLVLRRHRLWEVFLTRVLGLEWDQVHDHAERLEHATDDELANHLDDYLGNPEFDPHGHPVPTREGTVEEVDRLRLTSLRPGSVAKIVQCTNENAQLLDYFNEQGLVPGISVRLRSQAPFNGPLTLEVDGERRTVGVEAARTLLVKLVQAP